MRPLYGQTDLKVAKATPKFLFERRRGKKLSPWFSYLPLPDNSLSIVWNGYCEFWISSNGSEIRYHMSRADRTINFETHFLSQALSFSLLKRNIEPFHGTVLYWRNQTIALLGDSGMGKSTLALTLLQRGAKLLTDDLMILIPKRNRLFVQPGIPHLKLFENKDQRLDILRASESFVDHRKKRIFSLNPKFFLDREKALDKILVLDTNRQTRKVQGTLLSPKERFLTLVENTFNPVLTSQERLRSQMEWVSEIATKVPMYRLSYPKRWEKLSDVCDCIENLEEING